MTHISKLFALSFIAAGSFALAHGDEDHDTKAAPRPMRTMHRHLATLVTRKR